MGVEQLAFTPRPDPFGAPRALVDSIPAIPPRDKPNGPLTERRLRRFYFMLAGIFALGAAPILLGASPQWKAFGLGLLFPGAGFLYAGGVLGIVFAILSAASFAIIMFIWWARGVILAPPAVLIGAAALSAVWVGDGHGVGWMEWGIPAAVLGLHAYLANGRRKAFVAAQAKGAELNKDIVKAQPILRDYPVVAAEEMPAPQIAEFRRMLDLALQPVESWNGFTMDDKWQDGALRYQICTMSWNLALGQYTQLPAFHGYLNQAQENLIRKHIDRKTWDYWHWESLWGNFQAQKNPVTIDNIMLSGFLGVSLGLFETASGTSPFAAPGSLTFRWDEKTAFPYSHSSLLQEVVKNYKRYDIGWFPCEPRWVYSMCNLVGRTSLALHDARHGTNFAGEIAARFDKTMHEEMMKADGRIKVCTSTPFGFEVPSLSGLFGETWGIRFLTPHAPEEAERLWQVLKHEYIHVKPDGTLDMKLLPLGWDTRRPRDFAKWPDLNPLILTLWAALEMGDEEILTATRFTIDQRYGAGLADAMTWSRRNTVRDMVKKGLPEAWKKGPILSKANYPDVIVGRAVTDGSALNLVLHPGANEGRFDIGLSRLAPGKTYRILQEGVEFVAGLDGAATTSVMLSGRTPIDIVPLS